MKNLFNRYLLIFLSILFIGLIFSCEGAGTDAKSDDEATQNEEDAAEEVYTLGGSVNNTDVNFKLTPKASAGISRSASTTQELEGFLVYGDITLNCTGTIDTGTGEFIVSSSGSFGTIKLIFSLTGTITDGKVTSASVILTLYENDDIAGSFCNELVDVETEVEKTEKVCTVISSSFDFEGTWNADWSDGETHKLTLSDTSFSSVVYDPNPDTAHGESMYSYMNGTILKAEEGVNTDEWNLVFVTDDNLVDEPSLASYEIEIYPVFYLKAQLTSSGQLIIVPSFDEDDDFCLTKYDVASLFVAASDTDVENAEHGQYQIDRLTYTYDDITDELTGISVAQNYSLSSLITLAEGIVIDDLSVDDKAEMTYTKQ